MMYTKQEIFDRAVDGILKQGGPAINNGDCAYRAPGGRRCPVGHVLSDHYYRTTMEGNSVGGLACTKAVLPKFFASMETLLVALQFAHDEPAQQRKTDAAFIREFKGRARDVARTHKLKWTFK